MIRTMWCIVALTLSGCIDNPPQAPDPDRDSVFASITLVDEINGDPDIHGYATCNGGVCEIQIRRDKYPACITHEIMHGFSGQWHGDKPSYAFCKVDK